MDSPLLWRGVYPQGFGEQPAVQSSSHAQEQLLRSDERQFRGGLVFKARRLLVSLISRPRVIKKKKKKHLALEAAQHERLEQPVRRLHQLCVRHLPHPTRNAAF